MFFAEDVSILIFLFILNKMKYKKMIEKKIIGKPKICLICGPSDLPTT